MSARPVRPLPSGNGWIVSNWACAISALVSGSMSARLANCARSSMRAGTRSWCGAMYVAFCGPAAPPPIQTGSFRQRPAQSGCWSPSSARCMARMLLPVTLSAMSSAAVIAAVFDAMRVALLRDVSPDSAMRTRWAVAVSCSISDDDADSERSRMVANGPISVPSSLSNRVISVAASRQIAAVSESMSTPRPAMSAGTAGV